MQCLSVTTSGYGRDLEDCSVVPFSAGDAKVLFITLTNAQTVRETRWGHPRGPGGWPEMFKTGPAVAALNGMRLPMVVDTGAGRTLISVRTLQKIRGHITLRRSFVRLVLADGSPLRVVGEVRLRIRLTSQYFPVYAIVVERLQFTALLGIDFLTLHGFVVDLKHNFMHCEEVNVHVPVVVCEEQGSCVEQWVYAFENSSIAPRSAAVVCCSLRTKFSGEAVLESARHLEPQGGYMARSLVTVLNGQFRTIILNPTQQELHVKKGLKWDTCLVFLDDVIIFSRTFNEHVKRLGQVLKLFRQAGLKISPSKSSGISSDPTLTSKIRKYATLTCLHELQSFHGLAAYYRRFVRGFAGVSAPLYRLTQKSAEFLWSEDLAEAFSTLRSALTSEPVLPIGAVLSQLDEKGQEHPVAFAGRILSRVEQKYCVTRREMLAVVTFIEQFAPYLQDEFVLRTDHGALQWLQSFKDADGQWARWQHKLQRFRFTVLHRPGRQHHNADSLSRIICKLRGRRNERLSDDVHMLNRPAVAAISFSDVDGVLEKQL
uniref:RNA-directed DNA polymerase n=1 Tax=Trichuris muris TaxID=70415 RepID=A0A5S6QU71_TRIMR